MTIQCFSAMAILSRKGLLGIAAVIDVALQEDEPISAKAIAARHGLPPHHLEGVLQSLVRSSSEFAVPTGAIPFCAIAAT